MDHSFTHSHAHSFVRGSAELALGAVHSGWQPRSVNTLHTCMMYIHVQAHGDKEFQKKGGSRSRHQEVPKSSPLPVTGCGKGSRLGLSCLWQPGCFNRTESARDF